MNSSALNALEYSVSESDAMKQPNNIESNDELRQEENWMGICNMVQSVLYHSCDVYVDDNRILTSEGERAFSCIRNGVYLEEWL